MLYISVGPNYHFSPFLCACPAISQRLEKDIIGMRKDREECMTKFEVRSKISRGLMENCGFNQLVKHGLKEDCKIRRVILSILQHQDLGGLKKDLTDLSIKQRFEARELILFECNDSEDVTQDLIHFAEKKATPTGSESTGKRRQLSMFSLSDGSQLDLLDQIDSFKLYTGKTHKNPVTPDDWARVVRGLEVKKCQSDFREAHAKTLVQRGCPETVIYAPDDVTVNQEFIDNVTDLHESVDGVERKDLDTLLKFLEVISINRKSQEAQRDFSIRIRKLEVELVYATIARNQSSSITKNDLGNFSQLKELTSQMKDSEIHATNASDATKRKKAKFEDKFRKSLGCMPLLLMTTEQGESFNFSTRRSSIALFLQTLVLLSSQ